MRRRPRKVLATVLVLAAAFAILVLLLVPPRPRASLDAADPSLAAPATVRGAFHVHTNRSDGTGSVDDVAAAAARAGLQFLVLTDHGDGMRAPLPPALRHGVLIVDGVEISTSGGHYVALGLPAAPYQLAGEPRDVVEDVRRLGGFGVAAHPDSPKPVLRWTGWDAGIDGLEWLNADSEWRDESRGTLLRALTTYPWRPAATLGALLSHARTVLGRWDDLARTHRVVGLAGVDAHARLGFRDGPDPYRGRVIAKAPSYEASFRTFAVHAELAAPFSGAAAQDGATLIAALRAGHAYTTLDALATPGRVGFVASSGDRRARMGDFLPPADAVEWRAAVAAPSGSTLRLLCDGALAVEAPATTRLEWRQEAARGPAACRLEVGWDDGGRRLTWLITNPIYLRGGDPPRPPISTSSAAVRAAAERFPDDFIGPGAWVIERDPQSVGSWRAFAEEMRAPSPAPPSSSSTAAARAVPPTAMASKMSTIAASTMTAPKIAAPAVAAPGLAVTAGRMPALELTYQLRGGGRFSQFVAFVTPRVGSIARATRVSFRARADKPMRLSVQLRRPLEQPGEGERWLRSVYLDTTPRDVTVRFDDMRPVWPARAAQPPLAQVHALLLVVDTEHTPPGTSGTIVVGDLRFER